MKQTWGRRTNEEGGGVKQEGDDEHCCRRGEEEEEERRCARIYRKGPLVVNGFCTVIIWSYCGTPLASGAFFMSHVQVHLVRKKQCPPMDL